VLVRMMAVWFRLAGRIIIAKHFRLV